MRREKAPIGWFLPQISSVMISEMHLVLWTYKGIQLSHISDRNAFLESLLPSQVLHTQEARIKAKITELGHLYMRLQHLCWSIAHPSLFVQSKMPSVGLHAKHYFRKLTGIPLQVSAQTSLFKTLTHANAISLTSFILNCLRQSYRTLWLLSDSRWKWT